MELDDWPGMPRRMNLWILSWLTCLILVSSSAYAFGGGGRRDDGWRFAPSLDSTDVRSRSGSLTVVSHNVGNAGRVIVGSFGVKILRCPSNRLCWDWTVHNLRDWFGKISPDVILLQEAMGIGQVIGHETNGPVLPDGYEAQCLGGICVAWKSARAHLAAGRSCTGVSRSLSGVFMCPLVVDGSVVQFVSAYYPALNDAPAWLGGNGEKVRQRIEMAEYVFRGKEGLIDPAARIVVGGDFNTTDCTGGADCSHPYPANFWTAFGRTKAGYGRQELRYGASNAPRDDFSGVYDGFKSTGFTTHYAFGKHSAYDHLFANFGFGLVDPASSGCRNYACLEGWGGMPKLGERGGGDGTDHEGIFARLGWIR